MRYLVVAVLLTFIASGCITYTIAIPKSTEERVEAHYQKQVETNRDLMLYLEGSDYEHRVRDVNRLRLFELSLKELLEWIRDERSRYAREK